MRKINKAMFIFIFVCSLPFTLLNFCFAGTIEDLGKIKCRDFIFIHKKIPRIYVGNEGPYIIYENSLVEIKFSIRDINHIINGDIEEGNNLAKDIKNKLTSLTNNVIRFEMFNDDEKRRILEPIFSDLLENGQFVLKEKITNQYPFEIMLGYYGWARGLMEGQKGRLFFLPSGEIFFQKIDIFI